MKAILILKGMAFYFENKKNTYKSGVDKEENTP
jgi:hypothetical protein